MKISVIIPVYNTAPFVKQAVLSALAQVETAEVILVEDGSTDESLAVCKQLNQIYEKVKLFQHPNQQNLGAGASRNLGLKTANYPYIAFLDADDYYLPNRFKELAEIFLKNPHVNATHECAIYEVTPYMEEYLKKNKGFRLRCGMTKDWPKQEIFYNFLCKTGEWFILNTVVIKSDLIQQVGYFDESLRQTQDTDWLLRLCLHANLTAGQLHHPVAKIRMHENNRVHNLTEANYYRLKLFQKWWPVIMHGDFSRNLKLNFIRIFLDAKDRNRKQKIMPRKSLKIIWLITLLAFDPRAFLNLFR